MKEMGMQKVIFCLDNTINKTDDCEFISPLHKVAFERSLKIFGDENVLILT